MTLAVAPNKEQQVDCSVEKYFSTDEHVSFKKRIADLLHNHLNSDKICQGSDLDSLLKHFKAADIPQEGWSTDQFLSEIAELVLPHTTNIGSPYFIGHMTSLLPNFIRPLAELIATTNQNIVKVETAKAATLYERQALSMLHELIYNCGKSFYRQNIHAPEATFGIITSGGTLANMTALQVARNKSLSNDQVSVERDGLAAALVQQGFKRSIIIVSELSHYSFDKALGLLGMGSANVVELPTDAQKRIDLDELRQTLEHCQNNKIHVSAIVGIAGTTESGTIDPLEEMADIAKEFKVHFHVDAAWGGAMLFSAKHKQLLKGIEKADSVTIDGHKQLYLPMGIGMVMFKDPQIAEAIEKQANYIIRKESFDQGKRSIEGSRAANVFYLQAAMKLLGRSGFEKLIDLGMQRTEQMAQLIKNDDAYELLLEPQTNIILYRYIPINLRGKSQLSDQDNEAINQFNIQLQKKQRDIGHSFVSRTSLQIPKYGKDKVITLRVVLANPLTKNEHIKDILREQKSIAAELDS